MKRCLCISAGTSRGNVGHNPACASSNLKSLHILLLYVTTEFTSTTPPHPSSSAYSHLTQATTYSCSTTRLFRSGAGGDNGDQLWRGFALKRCSCTIPIVGLTQASISHTKHSSPSPPSPRPPSFLVSGTYVHPAVSISAMDRCC